MKRAITHTILIVITVLALLLTACSSQGASATPSTANAAQQPSAQAPTSADPVSIVDSVSYTDSGGYYHVAGAVRNNTDIDVTSVQLTLEVKDSNGKSLLRDANKNPVDSLPIQPFFTVLQPGEVSPFDYYLDTSIGTPASYNLSVTGHAQGSATRANVVVSNVQTFTDNLGATYIAGELVNQGSTAAQVKTLAGALVDASGKVLAANNSLNLVEYLGPSGATNATDRGPFEITIDGPVSNVANFVTYVEADTTDEQSQVPVDITYTNGYTDALGGYHLVGTVENKSNASIHFAIQGGLYAADKTVLDANYIFVGPMASGATLPFDISIWPVVDFVASAAEKVSSYTMQVDPSWVNTEPAPLASLTASGVRDIKKSGGEWDFTGQVVNDSGSALDSEDVYIGIYDAQGKLIGATSTTISHTGESIAAGSADPFSAYVSLAPSVDLGAVSYKITVIGVMH
jgi:hypothetical protein